MGPLCKCQIGRSVPNALALSGVKLHPLGDQLGGSTRWHPLRDQPDGSTRWHPPGGQAGASTRWHPLRGQPDGSTWWHPPAGKVSGSTPRRQSPTSVTGCGPSRFSRSSHVRIARHTILRICPESRATHGGPKRHPTTSDPSIRRGPHRARWTTEAKSSEELPLHGPSGRRALAVLAASRKHGAGRRSLALYRRKGSMKRSCRRVEPPS